MKAGAELVAENPETDFVLTHCGMLVDDQPETIGARKDGLARFAPLPNLYAKLSGLGTFVHRNDPDLIALIVDAAVDIFGSERLMFGSNFPIEKLWADYDAVLSTHRAAVERHGAKAVSDIMHGTAERIYRPL